MMAFDADVLIYAAEPGHPLGQRVARLFDRVAEDEEFHGVGSLMLALEVLPKVMREGHTEAERILLSHLGRLNLLPVDAAVTERALSYAVAYNLRAPDAIHLSTAVHAGASRFLTNNRKDFPKSIYEIGIIYPEDLPEP
ncbi:MAG: type II toxin-antitoxin system VapC family toxin [Promicromonosporaceae bacterium]|nr:type II toxin-antitoxin system VapC family toxin [Promicromonosporaceae bacterium]